jgi:conjugative relaxase-like TrwC/TraI family protein
MLTIRAMSEGKGYSSWHLEHSDYYSEGERVAGEWNGRGAELLGLSGAVNTADFEALRQGLNPSTGEFLRVRHSADRTTADGSKLAQGRSLGGDHRLIEADRVAVAEALKPRRTQRAGSGKAARMRTELLATWCLRSTTMIPAANLTPNYIRTRLRLT